MKIKVLLVDDEQQFVETLAQRLETRGFVVGHRPGRRPLPDYPQFRHNFYQAVPFLVLIPDGEKSRGE